MSEAGAPLAQPPSADFAETASVEAGASRQHRADETRRRVLEAALRVFSEHGFDGATTRQIAAEAGVNHAMIRYHFSGKEALWRAAVTLMFQRLNAELGYGPEERKGLTTEEGYREFIRRYVGYCARHPEHARIMVQESVRGGERLAWAVDQFIKHSWAGSQPVLDAQVQAGRLPDVARVSLHYIIVAACQLPFTLAAEVKALTGVDMQTPEAIEAHADAVIAVLLGPRRAG